MTRERQMTDPDYADRVWARWSRRFSTAGRLQRQQDEMRAVALQAFGPLLDRMARFLERVTSPA